MQAGGFVVNRLSIFRGTPQTEHGYLKKVTNTVVNELPPVKPDRNSVFISIFNKTNQTSAVTKIFGIFNNIFIC